MTFDLRRGFFACLILAACGDAFVGTSGSGSSSHGSSSASGSTSSGKSSSSASSSGASSSSSSSSGTTSSSSGGMCNKTGACDASAGSCKVCALGKGGPCADAKAACDMECSMFLDCVNNCNVGDTGCAKNCENGISDAAVSAGKAVKCCLQATCEQCATAIQCK